MSEEIVTFNPKLTAEELAVELKENFGIDMTGQTKKIIVKELKNQGAVEKLPEEPSPPVVAPAPSKDKEGDVSANVSPGIPMVKIKQPSVCIIEVGEEENNPNDFVCKLNGKTYQIQRSEKVKVPYGLYKHLSSQKKKKPIEGQDSNGKTRSETRLTSAYPFIQYHGPSEYVEKDIPKELFDALVEKGEMSLSDKV